MRPKTVIRESRLKTKKWEKTGKLCEKAEEAV